jgi:hypothetical protein
MSESERAGLAQEARGRIRETNRIVNGLDSSTFPQTKLDALVTIRGLVKSASEALEDGDIQAADSLSRKALLLASDLSPS